MVSPPVPTFSSLLKCGCMAHVWLPLGPAPRVEITWCDLHGAAGDLRNALRRIRANSDYWLLSPECRIGLIWALDRAKDPRPSNPGAPLGSLMSDWITDLKNDVESLKARIAALEEKLKEKVDPAPAPPAAPPASSTEGASQAETPTGAAG